MLENTLTTTGLRLKKRLIMRGYQETIVSDILGKFNMGIPYVLGACPGSGKTEMAIEVIIRLIESGQVDRVLILAHSTNVLKENFYDRLMQYFEQGDTIDIMRGQSDYNYDAIIQVMIPQNINHIIKQGQKDLIITDEAHHNVLAEGGNYSKIVEIVKPKFELLLTGTPSKFILQNNIAERDSLPMPYHINTIGMDVIGLEFFHKVRFDLIKSAYEFNKNDYNASYNIDEGTKFSYEDTEKTVNNVIVGVVRNIALRNGVVLPSCSDFALEGRKLIQSGGFGKTLIMCRNIEQADQISHIISNLFKIRVHVSQSQNDPSSDNLTRFKKNEFQFLCVVNRAKEGYDDASIVNLIDITMTHNIDLIYQMFCRVVRLDKNNPKPKLHIKVTSNAIGMPKFTMDMMTASLMLASTKNLTMFNGNNFRGFIMPKIEWEEVSEGQFSLNAFIDIIDEYGEKTGKIKKISDLMALDLVKIFVNDQEDLISGNERYAMTTLGESLDILMGDVFTDKESYYKLIRDNDIMGGDTWRKRYKEFSERDTIKYNGIPWTLFDQTQKDFFDECYPERQEVYSDKKGYFKLFKENDIRVGHIWGAKYKEFSERDGLKYSSIPWNLFKQTAKELFDECYKKQKFHLDKEGYFELFRRNKITTCTIWKDKYKELSKRDEVKYLSGPWKVFNQNVKEFLGECYPERQDFYCVKEGYFELIIKNKITSGSIWMKKYKELSKRDGLRYHVSPWNMFKQKPKEFFDECCPERQQCYSDKEGYFKLFRENGIEVEALWTNKYKELSKKDGIRYSSVPWKTFGQTAKELFIECYPERERPLLGKEEYFKVFREHNITSSKNWAKNYIEVSEKDCVKYIMYPHKIFNQSQKELFDEYRQRMESIASLSA
jgi:superfamily II DNA or RNA helicase